MLVNPQGPVPLSVDDPRIVSLPMVGDVNLFLKGTRPGVPIMQDENTGEDPEEFEVEVEIMIAGQFHSGL